MIPVADPDDTTHCPGLDGCELCDATRHLEVCTLHIGERVLCITLCRECAGQPVLLPPATVAQRADEHQRHLAGED